MPLTIWTPLAVTLVFLATLTSAQKLRVDQKVLHDVDAHGSADVLLMLDELEVDTSLHFSSTDADFAKIVLRLKKHAIATQQPLLAHLSNQPGCRVHQSFWATNAVAATVSKSTLSDLSGRSLGGIRNKAIRFPIRRIVSNNSWTVPIEKLDSEQPMQVTSSVREDIPEWNVQWIKADYLYEKGFKGNGIVIGNADTGVQFDHPALISSYRGSESAAANAIIHDYNWFDATQFMSVPNDSASECIQGIDTPCDDHGHGTHCTGTSAGTLQGIGVAPNALWVACRNMYNGLGSPATYIGCLEWMVEPTRLDRSAPDVTKRPHIISNSYGCLDDEDCDPSTFKQVLKVVRAAGIFMAVAAGNWGGAGCETVWGGPGNDENVCTVGALGKESNVAAWYSSRGPVTDGGSSRRKPDIMAPGSLVKSASCFPPSTYITLSGTSMATPAVAGAVALLWEAFPDLKRDVSKTEALLYASAVPLYDTDDKCGSDTNTTHPNNVYGYGLIDLKRAYLLHSEQSSLEKL